jgi:hypothetical protein
MVWKWSSQHLGVEDDRFVPFRCRRFGGCFDLASGVASDGDADLLGTAGVLSLPVALRCSWRPTGDREDLTLVARCRHADVPSSRWSIPLRRGAWRLQGRRRDKWVDPEIDASPWEYRAARRGNAVRRNGLDGGARPRGRRKSACRQTPAETLREVKRRAVERRGGNGRGDAVRLPERERLRRVVRHEEGEVTGRRPASSTDRNQLTGWWERSFRSGLVQ